MYYNQNCKYNQSVRLVNDTLSCFWYCELFICVVFMCFLCCVFCFLCCSTISVSLVLLVSDYLCSKSIFVFDSPLALLYVFCFRLFLSVFVFDSFLFRLFGSLVCFFWFDSFVCFFVFPFFPFVVYFVSTFWLSCMFFWFDSFVCLSFCFDSCVFFVSVSIVFVSLCFVHFYYKTSLWKMSLYGLSCRCKCLCCIYNRKVNKKKQLYHLQTHMC